MKSRSMGGEAVAPPAGADAAGDAVAEGGAATDDGVGADE